MICIIGSTSSIVSISQQGRVQKIINCDVYTTDISITVWCGMGRVENHHAKFGHLCHHCIYSLQIYSLLPPFVLQTELWILDP